MWAAGGAVEYAGQKLLGTADRIDVDGDGRCVVIDYKGSLSGVYALAAREQGHLGKVQALIYAQVVRRTLGLDPVGALYVCHGRVKRATGAYAWPRVGKRAFAEHEAQGLHVRRSAVCRCAGRDGRSGGSGA